MGLSEFLQQKELFSELPGLNFDTLNRKVQERTARWFRSHSHEHELLRTQLEECGLPADEHLLAEVKRHIALHYVEKLLPFCYSIEEYGEFLTSHVNADQACQTVQAVAAQGKGVLLASSHFGAVELIVPTCLRHKLSISPVLRFRSPELSDRARSKAADMARCGAFGNVEFIEIGKAGTAAALEMAGVLRKGGILLSMVDEKTPYSIEVELFGKKVWGGAGLDRLLKFANADIVIFAVFMVRLQNGTYHLQIHKIATDHPRPIAAIYELIENMAREYPEQWYFLHEEIPFVV
ncbi:MAG: hypothetical protein GF398_01205 [Chitinivibrionales bacterium]|nr:hypothetical protein [Chitinivibrionales bacterium]